MLTVGGPGLAQGLLDVSVKAALLLLGGLVATRALRRASASTRHQVWVVALCGVLLLPVLSAVLPALPVPMIELPAAVGGVTPAGPLVDPAGHGVTPAGPVIDADTSGNDGVSPIPRSSREGQATAAAGLSARRLPDADGRGESDRVGGAVDTDGIGIATPRSAVASMASSDGVAADATGGLGVAGWSGLIMALWVAGACLVLGRLALSVAAAAAIARRAVPVDDAVLLGEAADVACRLGIPGRVALARHDRITMPMAWGLLRPVILLPGDAPRWSAARRRVVLLHEMAHLKRRDCQTLLMARLVTAMHWFNPLAWIATRRLLAERERACDDLVLSSGTPGSDYAQHLLEIARAARGSAPAWATAAMARPNELEGRLLAILDPGRNRRRVPRAATTIALLAAGFLIVPLAAVQPFAEAAEAPQGSARVAARAAEIDVEDWAEELQLDPAMVEAALEQAVAYASELALETVTPSQEASSQGRNPRVMEAFFAALQDPDASIRSTAAQALGQLEDASAVDALAAVLAGDESARVREQAAWALGMIESDRAVAALSAALSDAEARVRDQAAWALGMIEDNGAVAALTAVLNDSEARVRAQAVWALGMIESAAAVPALVVALSDGEVRVRDQAAWALGMIESPEAVAALAAALRGDESARVRRQAAWALGMIEDEAGLDALLDAFSDEDLGVRRQALWAVGQISG